ncbi:hypothetical protein [Paraburkholderia sp. ZP32-5]|uniref:hypothetical protein n=1 Tax=Paraburkholderia sp. ZP32-5 TaxID=2883245 RepID=UPI001F3CFF3C|nr:hypothetical protein [Paraburkholderia sp. ZP32-5]
MISRSQPLDGEQFAACQITFLQDLFGYREYLRGRARETPTIDAFLPVFVTLLETMEINAPEEAQNCAHQLTRIIQILFPVKQARGSLLSDTLEDPGQTAAE